MSGSGSSGPRVVALVPAWEASSFIVPTLNALAAQTCPNLEILVSDDASRDGTGRICDRFASIDARFRVIHQPRNLGWTGNVNALLSAAQGDYLAFAFHDDLLAPRYLERCVDALEANRDAVLAYTDITLIGPDGNHESLSYDTISGVPDRLQRARSVARRQDHWWIPNRGVFRASAARAIGGLRRHLAGEYSADWPWLLRMSLLGPFVRVPENLCTKVLRKQSLSQRWDSTAWPIVAVALSASGAVRRAGVPMREALVLQSILIAYAAREGARGVKPLVGRWLRRLGLRRPRTR